MRKILAIAKLGIAALVGAGRAAAHTPQMPQAQAMAPKAVGIDVATAKKMVAAATSANGHLSVAVVEANGDLEYFERMDGAISKAATTS